MLNVSLGEVQVDRSKCYGDRFGRSRRRDAKKSSAEQRMDLNVLLQALGYLRSERHWVTLEAVDPRLAHHYCLFMPMLLIVGISGSNRRNTWGQIHG